MATRSTKLASNALPVNAWSTQFTVPTGMTYLVKSVIMWNPNGAADTVYVELLDVAGHAGPLIYALSLSASARTEWDGWVALIPTDILRALSVLGGTQIWVSGAILPGTA